MISHFFQTIGVFFSLVGVTYTVVVALYHFQGESECKIDTNTALGATLLLGFSILCEEFRDNGLVVFLLFLAMCILFGVSSRKKQHGKK